MERIAGFEKVSEDIFTAEAFESLDLLPDEAHEAYEALKFPKRATKGSAGYDFYAPADITLAPGESVKVPTGMRARMDDGWVLMIFPRSGMGFKYRLMLDNTVGVIDADYYYSDNEGHIMIKVTNNSALGSVQKCTPDEGEPEISGKVLHISAGQAFAQGVFLPFGITTDDDVENERNGGFGSTG